MAGIVPTISSGTAGPLGVLQLPRLWSKLLLDANGKLADGYDSCGSGFDRIVVEGLGLDCDAVIDFIKTKRPTYPQFESWVKEHATKLDQASIQKINETIKGYNHRDETRKTITQACGIPDDGSILDAVSLNDLEDWNDFHAQVNNS
ncbi:MAG: DUF5069 domain-containing protein [Armatimonadetes bacterium]|nr:DUF5069 domain-containing protein [Armatimonadota bacterium]